MCRQDVNNYFTMLLQICQQNGFQANPRKIFSMDECGLQMNGEQGIVFANKGSRYIRRIPAGEKGETITLIACCNEEEEE
jgi:hypothetical protein